MAGQINISGTTDAVQLHGNDAYTQARDFTFPDESGELLIKTANDDVPGIGSINGGPLAGLRNALVNGNLQTNQRDYFTKAGAMNEYTVDRWVGVSVSTGMTIRPETTLGGNYAEAGGAAPGDQVLAQGIELPAAGVKGSFQPGTTWTISVLAATGAPTVALNWQETVGQGANNIVELSATAMQSTGKTIGGYTQYFHTHTFSNTAITANQVALTVEIGIGNNRCTQIQLEPGPVATPFEQRPIGLELSLCQRYYEKLAPRLFTELAVNKTNLFVSIDFKVPKRAKPDSVVNYAMETVGNGTKVDEVNATLQWSTYQMVNYFYNASRICRYK